MMNQVYFIHLVLARLSRWQAFGANPNATVLSLKCNPSTGWQAERWQTDRWRTATFILMILWSILSIGSTGCVGTRGGPPARFAPKPGMATGAIGPARRGAFAMDTQQMGPWDYQPGVHEAGYDLPPPQHSLPCRLGLMGKRIESGNTHCSCTTEVGEKKPRESLTLPWLKGKKSKPPEVSRFLPVPTHPVFEPQPSFETIAW